jgi:hypothetical protein
MTRQTVARVLVAFAVCCLALPVAPASAHFGNHGELPVSNYRTRILAVSPDVDGLSMRVIDAGGRLELTWRGQGDLIVDGYEGEPYLRVGDDGVFTNVRSTATYLNQSRYATSSPPSMADNAAEPSWSRMSGGRTVRWHDHRSHWMSPQPPAAVAADPDTEQPVIPAWTITLTAGPTPVAISGDVTWVPPPSSLPWYAAAVVIGIAALAALHTRWWRTFAWATVGLLGVAMVAGLGLARAGGANLTFWPVAARVVVLAAAAALVLSARRRTAYPPAPLLVAGVVGLYFGGWRAAGVLSHSQLTVSGPHWLIRTLVAASFGLAAAAAVRVIAFVIAAVARPEGPQAKALGAARSESTPAA